MIISNFKMMMMTMMTLISIIYSTNGDSDF